MTVNQLKWNVFFVAVATLFACNSDQPKEATEAVEQQVEIPTKQKTIEINGVDLSEPRGDKQLITVLKKNGR